MLKIFKKKNYRHLNKVLVSRVALEHNYLQLAALNPQARIAPVLKSNAYGHGLQTVAPIFDSFSPPFLVVDSLHEAYQLHSLQLNTPILIIGYTHPQNYLVKQLPFHFTVFDLETAQALNKGQKKCQIHLFVDTGMNREGIPLSDLDQFVKEIKKLSNLNIVGLASHFADADNSRSSKSNHAQLEKYRQALDILKSNQVYPTWRHVSASGAAMKIRDESLNMIRAGIASYGINPLEKRDKNYHNLDLKPALTFVSTIAQIKTLNKGETVGYNNTFKAPKKMTIGIVPAGYYDGVNRRLSNKGYFLVNDKKCRILGRVSMNITVIDLSSVPDSQVNDEATIISNKVKDPNSLTNIAQTCKTIPYEQMVKIAESLRREVVE